MRGPRFVTLLLLLAGCSDVRAATIKVTASATIDATHTIITLDVTNRLENNPAIYECVFPDASCLRYRLVASVPAPGLPGVKRVTKVARSNNKLDVELGAALTTFKGISLVAEDISAMVEGVFQKVTAEARLVSRVAVDACDLGRIRYIPVDRVADLPKAQQTLRVEVRDHDTEEEFRQTGTRISAFVPCGYERPSKPEDLSVLTIHLGSRLPRGRTLDISVWGIESDAVTGQVKTPAYPDVSSARYAFSGQYVANRRGTDSWAINGFLHPPLCEFPNLPGTVGGVVEADVGATGLNLPDTIRVAVAGRYLAGSWAGMENHALAVIPEFRTDRHFENEDGGATLSWSAFIPPLHKPLASRRAVVSHGQALRLHWGWRIDPVLGIEAGDHVRSASPDVEGHGYFRVAATARGVLEYERFTLDARYEARWLTTTEVNMSGTSVTSVDDGFRGFLSAELGVPVGPISVVVRYVNGQQPPNFRNTNATTFGVKCYF